MQCNNVWGKKGRRVEVTERSVHSNLCACVKKSDACDTQEMKILLEINIYLWKMLAIRPCILPKFTKTEHLSQ